MSDKGQEFVGGVVFNELHQLLQLDYHHPPLSTYFEGVPLQIWIIFEQFAQFLCALFEDDGEVGDFCFNFL